MKTVIKTSIGGPFLRPYFILTAIALGLLALSPKMEAVSPPPDGGYPGQNTAEGQGALLHLAGGTYNTALGWASLSFNVTGNFNTGVGAATLLNNTADNNTATGAGALLNNTTGSKNTANGTFALYSNIAGGFNTATGFQALKDSTGDNNTATGADALLFNTIGNDNTATGENALRNNTTGVANTATGQQALLANTTGTSNAAVGDLALLNNRTGNSNTAVGSGALESNTTGSGNIALGYLAGFNVTTANNVICIGADGNNVDNACYIGQIFGATSSGGTAVFVNSNGRLGTATSSQRFKDDIKLMDQASEALFALKPVTFRYKKEIDPARTSQFGLVAEEVEKVNRDLVVRDKEGKAYSVRYDQVNAMLLNEFLKEHHQVQDLKTIVAGQQKQIEVLTAGLQKVSAQLAVASPSLGGLEVNNVAPQILLNTY